MRRRTGFEAEGIHISLGGLSSVPEDFSVHRREEGSASLGAEEKMPQKVSFIQGGKGDVIQNGDVRRSSRIKTGPYREILFKALSGKGEEHSLHPGEILPVSSAQEIVGPEGRDHITGHAVCPEKVIGKTVSLGDTYLVVRVGLGVKNDGRTYSVKNGVFLPGKIDAMNEETSLVEKTEGIQAVHRSLVPCPAAEEKILH